MHLVDINTRELKEFTEGNIPPYAILSHKWGPGELNFKEVYKRRIDEKKRGYRKLTSACHAAAKHKVEFIWIDTCCIDKKSSAELSEAINSMFLWYENAEICLAYLEDIGDGPDDKSFKDSVWFKRSWTLQELLAPRAVHFYDSKWKTLGTKESMTNDITATTRIPKIALMKEKELFEFPVAVRMSWASNRKATRTEDIAYSLLGIFDVNMPLLYGEGSKSFIRLQEEIIRRSPDASFLLWGFGRTNFNLLAKSPADFPVHEQDFRLSTRANVLSSSALGLEIKLLLNRFHMNMYAAVIASTDSTPYALILRKHPETEFLYKVGTLEIRDAAQHQLHWYAERNVTILWGSQGQKLLKSIDESAALEYVVYGFEIRTEEILPIRPFKKDPDDFESLFEESAEWLRNSSSNLLRCKFPASTEPGVARIECTVGDSEHLWMYLWFDIDSRPCVHIRNSNSRISYRGRHEAPVVDLADVVDWQKRFLNPIGGREYEIANVRDEDTGTVSYLFRVPGQNQMCCRIPKDVIPLDHEVWISFVPPRLSPDPEFNGWIFEISSHEIELIFEGPRTLGEFRDKNPTQGW